MGRTRDPGQRPRCALAAHHRWGQSILGCRAMPEGPEAKTSHPKTSAGGQRRLAALTHEEARAADIPQSASILEPSTCETPVLVTRAPLTPAARPRSGHAPPGQAELAAALGRPRHAAAHGGTRHACITAIRRTRCRVPGAGSALNAPRAWRVAGTRRCGPLGRGSPAMLGHMADDNTT